MMYRFRIPASHAAKRVYQGKHHIQDVTRTTTSGLRDRKKPSHSRTVFIGGTQVTGIRLLCLVLSHVENTSLPVHTTEICVSDLPSRPIKSNKCFSVPPYFGLTATKSTVVIIAYRSWTSN